MKNEVNLRTIVFDRFVPFYLIFIYLCNFYSVSSLHLHTKPVNSLAINSLEKIQILAKSNNDYKDYYVTTLPNGLIVYIIQDHNAVIEAASISVGGGAVMDKDILGLAHFTEHMLFLGSKKFNNATYFIDHISLHNGKYNGNTKLLRTSFFYKIDRKYSEQAFNIFSELFIEPSFNETYIDKEVNAVNSEFEKNCQLDSQKKEHILRKVSDPNSYFFRFRTGNNITLQDYAKANNINLVDRVKDYFTTYYVPNNMKLILYGSDTLDNYKMLAISAFGKLKKKEIPKHQELALPFQPFNNSMIILYETIKDKNELEFNFIMYLNDNNTSVQAYYSFIINRSIENFRKYSYFTSISARNKSFYKGFSAFRIILKLTQKGIKNLGKVINLISSYLDFLKKSTFENQKVYAKIKSNNDNKYINSKKKFNAISYMKKVADDLWEFPDSLALSQYKIMDEFNKTRIEEFNKMLTLNNSIIMFGSKQFNNSDLFVNYNNFLKDFDATIILKDYEKWLNTFYGCYQLLKIDKNKVVIRPSNKEKDNSTFNINLDINLQNLTVGVIQDNTTTSTNETNTTTFKFINESVFDKAQAQLSLCHTKKCKKLYSKDENDLNPEIIFNTSHMKAWHKV